MRKGTYVLVGLQTKVAEGQPTPLRPGFLCLVTAHEMHDLRQWLVKGQLPADLENKLQWLESRGMMHQFIAQNCRLFFTLLNAVYTGMFKEMGAHERDEMLRVLAYVRKDEDAIPDYTSGGFTDDLQEVRAAILQMQSLLNRFKAWRLCHQVPHMWRN